MACFFAVYCYKNAKNRYLEKCVFIFRMQSFNTLCVFLTKFWVCYRFSKGPFFEILYKGEQCNDDILSIMLHNSTIWCQMMAILASFDIKEAVFQPILCFCITGDKFIVQSESKRRGENLKHKKSLFNAGHEC